MLQLDKRAVLKKGEADFVYVVDHGRAALRPVELGRDDGSHVQVVRGVREGDRLILNPSKDAPEEMDFKD